MPSRTRLLVGAGVCLLVAGLAVSYAAAVTPAHTTEIERSAPSEAAMANASASYTASEIDAVPVADRSAAERRAVEGAIAAGDGRYTDRGASDGGETLDYRNDIVESSFVAHEGQVYLVRTWIDVNYRLLPVGVAGVLLGLPPLCVGLWRRRRPTATGQ